MATVEQTQNALVPAGKLPANGQNANGHARPALSRSSSQTRHAAHGNGNGNGHLSTADDAPVTRTASIEAERIGWRGWWRTAQVVRVMWLLSFYLFLENY